tara:strand:+ start:617 stop:1042 length:426 start_codon:yes stop_codon:yes gene_type:complete
MSSTFNDVRAAIEGRIATEMASSPTYPVNYQNAPFTPPNNTPWISVSLIFGDNSYATLRPPTTGESFNRQTGTLIVDVFTSAGVGAGANYTIVERLKDKFDRAKFSSIIFDPSTGPTIIKPAEQEAFFQTQFSATFDAYLD